MILKFSYVIIPLIVGYIAYRGARYTKAGLDWYAALRKPDWTPSQKLIKEIWIFLCLLVMVAVTLFWTVTQLSIWHVPIAAALLYNGYLNIVWSRTFFVEHDFAAARKQLVRMNIAAGIAIIFMWPIYLLPALLLVPYAVWIYITTRLVKELGELNPAQTESEGLIAQAPEPIEASQPE